MTIEETVVEETITQEQIPETEEKLDNQEGIDNISSIEDTGSQEPEDDFDLASLLNLDLSNPTDEPTIIEEQPKEEIKTSDMSKTISELNSLLEDNKTQLENKDKEMEELRIQLDSFAPIQEKLDNAEAVWTKLEENKMLYNLAIRHINGEEIDLEKYIDAALGEELDGISNGEDLGSDAEQPAGNISLMDRMMQTNAR